MPLNASMSAFLPVLCTLALLTGCVDRGHYAPVSNNQQITVIEANHSGSKQNHNRQNNINSILKTAGRKNTQNTQTIYLVKKGDTLYSIATGHGLNPGQVAHWNRISPPYRIIPGQTIKLFQPKRITKNNTSDSKNTHKTPARGNKAALASVPRSKNPQEKKSTISTENKKMLKLFFDWPIKGRIYRNFAQSNKKGIDIAGKIGQKVRAAEAGKVAYSGKGLLGLGNLIIIKHNDLYLSAYANNSRLLVQEGEQVKKGQVIAQVGKALSKKAALHFEIRKNGVPVNPLKLLPKSDRML